MLFFFEVFGRNEIHFFTVIILGGIGFIAVIFYIMVLTAVAFAIAVVGEDVFSNAVIKTHEISAFLVWGRAVSYGACSAGGAFFTGQELVGRKF